METRKLGNTALRVSALGFGCGAVGGLLVKGDRGEMKRAVARAIELGVTYFDTAAIYGDGKSEESLGWVLEELGVDADVVVGTKVRLQPEQLSNIEQAVTQSVEASLKRLRREHVDLIQLHNSVAADGRRAGDWVSVDDVAAAMQAFAKLREQGKVRFWGFNGLGDSAAVLQALAGDVHTVQACFSLLNPSAGVHMAPDFHFQDYGQLIERAADKGVGVIAIRVLAGGALSGSAERQANAATSVQPIASSASYAEDVALAQRFRFLVNEGYAGSLPEAAVRFALGQSGISTVLVGISTLEQLEQAAAFAGKGPLPAAALDRLRDVWAGYAAA